MDYLLDVIYAMLFNFRVFLWQGFSLRDLPLTSFSPEIKSSRYSVRVFRINYKSAQLIGFKNCFFVVFLSTGKWIQLCEHWSRERCLSAEDICNHCGSNHHTRSGSIDFFFLGGGVSVSTWKKSKETVCWLSYFYTQKRAMCWYLLGLFSEVVVASFKRGTPLNVVDLSETAACPQKAVTVVYIYFYTKNLNIRWEYCGLCKDKRFFLFFFESST